jgi:ureidoglycolate hydrolase
MVRVIPISELTDEAFEPFGRIIRAPAATEPDRTGPGWQAWYGYATLDCPDPLAFGSVVTEARDVVIDVMERHVHTFELLYPHDHPLIQPLAPPGALDDDAAQPDPDSVTAFVLRPGDAIAMHPGTWHSPAFPTERTCTYTFAVLEPSFPYVPEWIPLKGNASVRVG